MPITRSTTQAKLVDNEKENNSELSFRTCNVPPKKVNNATNKQTPEPANKTLSGVDVTHHVPFDPHSTYSHGGDSTQITSGSSVTSTITRTNKKESKPVNVGTRTFYRTRTNSRTAPNYLDYPAQYSTHDTPLCHKTDDFSEDNCSEHSVKRSLRLKNKYSLDTKQVAVSNTVCERPFDTEISNLQRPLAKTKKTNTKNTDQYSQGIVDSQSCPCRKVSKTKGNVTLWIECSDCLQWYHTGCVGLSELEEKTLCNPDTHYTCPRCLISNIIKKVSPELSGFVTNTDKSKHTDKSVENSTTEDSVSLNYSSWPAVSLNTANADVSAQNCLPSALSQSGNPSDTDNHIIIIDNIDNSEKF